VKIAVFGLGYVGSVTSACLASMGHDVIGVDIVESKVEAIRSGRSPIVERDLDRHIAEGIASGRLGATTDATQGVRDAVLVLVCVGTPSREDGSLDLSHAENAAREVGRALAAHPHPSTIVFRSTMLPGSVHDVLTPAIEAASGLRAGRDFGVAYNPEFLREGTAVGDFFDAPYAIVGADDDRGANHLEELYGALPGAVIRVDVRTAEMLKYVNNAFHGLKVAFANEIGRLCQREGIDSHDVMRLFCLDTKLNLSPYYLKPGFAFGGSCLPKDLRAITHLARERNLELPVLFSVLASNELHIQAAVAAVERQRKKRVGVLGLSFKADTDDLRESPIVRVVNALVGKGYELLVHDNHLSVSRMVGANRAFLEREIPYLEKLFREDPRAVVAGSDVVVLAHAHPAYRDVPKWLRDDQVLVDFVRGVEPDQLSAGRYVGLAW
jgi:GDP-mannose 6-dehydrogenase